MKQADLEPLTLLGSTCWYAEQYSVETVSTCATGQEILGYMRQLQRKCRSLYEREQGTTAEGRTRQRYSAKIERTGTKSDKAAQYVLHLKAAPFAYVDDLEGLFGLFSQSKRAMTDFMGAVYEAIECLVPPSRALIPLSHRLAVFESTKRVYRSEDTLLMAYFEDRLIGFLDAVFRHVLEASGEPLPQLGVMANEFMGFISKYQSFTKPAIKFLQQQFGSGEQRVSSSAMREALALESQTAQLESLVHLLSNLQGVNDQLTKLELDVAKSKRKGAQVAHDRSALSNRETFIFKQLHNYLVYLSRFKLIDNINSKQLNTNITDILFQIMRFMLKIDKDDNKKVGKQEISRSGIVRFILTIMNKIFKNVQLDANSHIQDSISSLIDVSYASQFNISVLINQMVLKYINNQFQNRDKRLNQQFVNRYMQSVYSITARYDTLIINDKNNYIKFYQLLVQLGRTYAGGIIFNKQFFSSVIKRLIQNQLQAINPEVMNNCLLSLQMAMEINFEQRQKLNQVRQRQSFKSIFPFDSPFAVASQEQFNIFQEDPLQSKAIDDQFWEAQLLCRHYHPSVRMFGNYFQDDKICQYIDVGQQLDELIKQKIVKQHPMLHAVQPFSFNHEIQVIQGDTRYLTDRTGKMVNQIHLERLHRIFHNQGKASEKVEKLRTDDDIDQVILKDLIKKGIVQEDNYFAEMKKLLDNDPEYQKILLDARQNKERLSQQRIHQLDGELDWGEEELEEEELEEGNMSAPEPQAYQGGKSTKLPKMVDAQQFRQMMQEDNPLLQAMRRRVRE